MAKRALRLAPVRARVCRSQTRECLGRGKKVGLTALQRVPTIPLARGPAPIDGRYRKRAVSQVRPVGSATVAGFMLHYSTWQNYRMPGRTRIPRGPVRDHCSN